MGTPKLKNFPPEKVAQNHCKDDEAAENAKLKREIENYKNIINNKLKDPKLAKRAALIIQELLKGHTSKGSDKDKK